MELTCSQCGETKDESEFYRDQRYKERNGHRFECKPCTDGARLKGKTIEEVRADNAEYMRNYRRGIRVKGGYGPRRKQ